MTGVALIAAERARQFDEEGFSAEHDDTHVGGDLALAAACYASPILLYGLETSANGLAFTDPWPFERQWDKRRYRGNLVSANCCSSAEFRIRLLIKAGALIAAEIDRLQRLTGVRAARPKGK